MTDLEDMMVDRDMTYEEARDVLADASDSDEDRYERHRERLSDFAEQEREERRREYAKGYSVGLEDGQHDRVCGIYAPGLMPKVWNHSPRTYWLGRARGYRA